jgi:hypothetical protein
VKILPDDGGSRVILNADILPKPKDLNFRIPVMSTKRRRKKNPKPFQCHQQKSRQF